MAHKEVKAVLTESTIPRKQLVESVALGTRLVLSEQSTGRCLIAMFLVHVVGIVAIAVVETEIQGQLHADRKSTRLNSSHANISYAVFCLKKKKKNTCKYL